MKLGLLICDHVAPEYRPEVCDYPEMFEKLLGPHIPGLVISQFDTCGGDLPTVVEACDAYLCTGARSSSNDDEEWISELKRFVRHLHEQERPFIGICFGHQVLAEALGGEVKRADNGWGAGIHSVEILRREGWMNPPADHVKLPHMHQDQVTRLPDGATLLGRTEHCPIAVFRAGRMMLGIQGHPEFPDIYSEALIRDRIDRIGGETAEKALLSLQSAGDEDLVARWIAEFLNQGLL